MKKNLILTIAIGDVYKRMSKFTHPTIEKYANRIGADFIVVKETQCSTPHWEKFLAIYNYLNKYERILYLDTDVIVREDCPNLFQIIPSNQLALFNELPFTSQRNQSLFEACKEYGITLPRWNGKYYNTGVMLIPRHFKQLFKKPEKEVFNFYEQGYFNAYIAKYLERAGNEYVIFELSYKFNRMTCMDQFTGEERFDSYIIHYAGYPSLEFVLALIKKDLERWKYDYPIYNYKKHILINVQGGLGDQICAEPVIRFLKEQIYKFEDITIVTHWPRIFRHLDMSVYNHDEFKFKKDTPYYHVLSLPGPESLMWKCVSHLLSHSVDYIAMALLKRILPNESKRIKIEIDLKDTAELIDTLGVQRLDEFVLVHPGRHWESKTFPKEWWQSVIDGLHKKGLKVCLIGQDEETRGTIDIEVRKGILDIRNLLSFGALIALISHAKVLISNDSAPIHIAGVFDNGIILIPTCKHPDHILPYRHGNQYFRAKALYKKLMCYEYESSPTTVYGSSAHYLPGDFYEYLPEPKIVVEETLKMYKGN